MLWMTPVVDNSAAQNIAILSNNPQAQAQAATDEDTLQGKATQGHLGVTNHQGVPEQYELKLLVNGKLAGTWAITLNDGQSWQKTIAWHTNNYAMLANLYLLPNTSTPFRYVNNGACVSNIKLLPTVLKAEDPCDGKAP
jgi:outer membrane usher protein FimD/PapC